MSLFDDLRDDSNPPEDDYQDPYSSDDSAEPAEDADAPKAAKSPARKSKKKKGKKTKKTLGMTPAQFFLLSVLLFMVTCIFSIVMLLVTGTVVI